MKEDSVWSDRSELLRHFVWIPAGLLCVCGVGAELREDRARVERLPNSRRTTMNPSPPASLHMQSLARYCVRVCVCVRARVCVKAVS